MFGSNWGTNNNNQQQQQQNQTSAFGQPSTFGGSAFGGGTSNAFGQQQQQQPQANPMFGNLTPATNNNNNAGGGFSAFAGGNNAQNNAGTSAFGAPKQGFGAFGGGGTSAFGGGGGAFGQTQGTAFGGATNNSSAFGTPQSTSLFANKTGTGVFGAATAGTENVAPVTTGSSNPPYAAFSEKDPASASVTLNYQSISCMPAYRGTSFEEIRFQDYAQGRKTSGGFGQSAAFGGVQQPTSIFGQTQQQQQPAQQASIFGGATNAQPTTGFGGAFGGSNAPSTSVFGGGGGAFGQPQQQQQQQQQAASSPFGSFGQPQAQQQQQQPQTTGVFGGGGGVFGGTNNAAKPAFGTFGGTAFGSSNSTPNPLGGNAQPTNSIFGNNANTQPTTGFGSFGNNNNTNAPKPSIFGQPAAPATTNTFGGSGGLFGSTANNQQPAAQPTAGFGGIFSNPAQPATTTGSIFGGGTTNAAAPANPNPLFGNGGGIFGNNNNQQQQQQQQQQQGQATTGIFGKPAAPLFPALGGSTNTNQAGPSLFGNSQTNGLFGSTAAKPLAPALTQSNPSMFGSMNNNNLNASSGMLTASIAEPISADLFAMLPTGPGPYALELPPKKRMPMFIAPPPPSLEQLRSRTPASSKLRGFGASRSSAIRPTLANPFNFTTSAVPGALSLSRTLQSPDALGRSASPALGSGSRSGVKKLILDKKVDANELTAGSPGRGKIVFSPALGIAMREKETARTQAHSPGQDSPTPAARTTAGGGTRFTAAAPPPAAEDGDRYDEIEPLEGEYWSRPDMSVLRLASHGELTSYKGLTVGRAGYGEVTFLKPVDLTGIKKLDELFGLVIQFDDKECAVYPDIPEVEKPPVGSGLNVPARIRLLNCWAVDKATREPIKDPSHPAAIRTLKRLKHMKATHFENFDYETGEWTFTVEWF
ncbi:unnamed protein product [Mycena citricolor]|uniref:Peptidase S59 domain-containing protein n=1 Tax=Mycena citricolor TaxID=2018698 RepID=A0AAD2K2F6_9AGAR|nr:unnamed protein product [Mycena citricolor]